jgi:hypothetical protein
MINKVSNIFSVENSGSGKVTSFQWNIFLPFDKSWLSFESQFSQSNEDNTCSTYFIVLLDGTRIMYSGR